HRQHCSARPPACALRPYTTLFRSLSTLPSPWQEPTRVTRGLRRGRKAPARGASRPPIERVGVDAIRLVEGALGEEGDRHDLDEQIGRASCRETAESMGNSVTILR